MKKHVLLSLMTLALAGSTLPVCGQQARPAVAPGVTPAADYDKVFAATTKMPGKGDKLQIIKAKGGYIFRIVSGKSAAKQG